LGKRSNKKGEEKKRAHQGLSHSDAKRAHELPIVEGEVGDTKKSKEGGRGVIRMLPVGWENEGGS